MTTTATPTPVQRMALRDAHDYQPRHPEAAALADRMFQDQITAGKVYGKIKGYEGRSGGWIYNTRGKAICHGWASLAHRHIWYDRDARGYRFGALALRRLDDYLDGKAVER